METSTHTPLTSKCSKLLPDPIYCVLFFFLPTSPNIRSGVLGKRIGLLFHKTSQFHRARGTLSVGSESSSSIRQTLHRPRILCQLSCELSAGALVRVKKNDSMSSIGFTWLYLYVALIIIAKHSLWLLSKISDGLLPVRGVWPVYAPLLNGSSAIKFCFSMLFNTEKKFPLLSLLHLWSQSLTQQHYLPFGYK